MNRRTVVAAALTLGVAVAMVSSALAIGGAPQGQAVAPAAKAKVKIEVKAAGPPPPVRVAPMMKLAAPAVNVEAQFQNYLRQFRPILCAEYHIVRVVCRPTPEQRKLIARSAEKTVREAARKYAGMFRRPMNVAQRAALDPRKQIREGLARSLEDHLPAEMAGRYREELARRDASRKQLAIRNIVALLDHDLVLARDQRDKLEASLAAHWDDSWCQSMQMFMFNNRLVPSIPDQYVVPYLNEAQKTIWSGIQKFHGYFGGFEMMGGMVIDDPLEDEELREARLEAARDDPKPAPNPPGGPVLIPDVMIKRASPAAKAASPPAPAEKAVPK